MGQLQHRPQAKLHIIPRHQPRCLRTNNILAHNHTILADEPSKEQLRSPPLKSAIGLLNGESRQTSAWEN